MIDPQVETILVDQQETFKLSREHQLSEKSSQKILISNYGTLFDLSFYNNNEQVICSGNDHEISFWDIKTGKKIQTLKGHSNSVTKVVASPYNQNIIVSTSADKSLKVWTLKERELSKEQEKENLEKLQQQQQQQNSDIQKQQCNARKKILNDNKFDYEFSNFENPDKKTLMGLTFISENLIIFGQTLNKAYIYNILDKKVEHVYEFSQDTLKNVEEIQFHKNYIEKDYVQIKQQKQEKEVNQKQKLEDEKKQQSWVTEIGFLDGLVVLCENSRLHFIDQKQNFEAVKIFKNTHNGHILSMKIFQNYILIGSSDSYTYLYSFDRQNLSLHRLLKLRSHKSAIMSVNLFQFQKKQQNENNNNSDHQQKQEKSQIGIMCAAFDPIVKFYDLQGEPVFQVDDAAGPNVWDSNTQTLIARDQNITREINIKVFE